MEVARGEAAGAQQVVAPRLGEVVGDHLGDELGEGVPRLPAERLARLRRVAQQARHLGRAEVARVDAHDDGAGHDRALAVDRHVPRGPQPGAGAGLGAVPRQREPLEVDGVDDADLLRALALEDEPHADLGEGGLHELAHRVLRARGDHVVAGLLLLQHQVHGSHVVTGMAPVAPRVEVADPQRVLQAEGDARDGAGDLARDEGLAADRALVVEEDAVGGVHAVRLAVVDRDPVAVELGGAVRAARVEGRGLALRHLLHEPVHLAGRGLVEAHLALEPEDPDRLEQPQRAERV